MLGAAAWTASAFDRRGLFDWRVTLARDHASSLELIGAGTALAEHRVNLAGRTVGSMPSFATIVG